MKFEGVKSIEGDARMKATGGEKEKPPVPFKALQTNVCEHVKLNLKRHLPHGILESAAVII